MSKLKLMVLFTMTVLIPGYLFKLFKYKTSQEVLVPITQFRPLWGLSLQALTSEPDVDTPSSMKLQRYLSRLSTVSFPAITESNQALKDKASNESSFLPICNKYYKDAHKDSNLLVIPRRAYYDHRSVWYQPERGGGKVVVLLTEMSDLAINTIKACKINGHITTSHTVIKENTNWVRKKFPHLTYSTVIVKCLRVPSEALEHGGKVHLIHKQETDNCYSQVESEQPLVVKHHKPGFVEKGQDSVLICISVFKRPQFFNEWLKYQKHIGIDRIHVAADPSFSVNATSAYPYLREALDSGFVTMEVWSNPLGEKVYYYSQLLKLQDCVMQNEGIFQYALLLDSDEFFNPLIAKEKSIGFYVRNLYQYKNVATVCFKWVKYFCQVHPSRAADTGNLTATLDDYTDIRIRSERKCMHKLSGVLFIDIHSVNMAVKGFSIVNARNIAYIAHFKPKDQC